MKPLLADDYIESKLRFPLLVQPKVDGVRGLNMAGQITARSLKPFKNQHMTTLFSSPDLIGFDGEFAAQFECHPDLCRLTSSATGTIKGEPFLLWWLFDYVTEQTRAMPYRDRYAALRECFHDLANKDQRWATHLRLMPSKEVYSLAELLRLDEAFLTAGYEGTIIRDPSAPHKEGRSGKQPTLWRIKRFVDFEFTVHEIVEGEENQNEAQLNELGHTFRSSHQENMVANAMIGAMLGRVVKEVLDPMTKAVLFGEGDLVRVGAGCLTHDQRRYYFQHQAEFMQQIHKAKFFPKGIKDKPRFPTWQSFRAPEDMS